MSLAKILVVEDEAITAKDIHRSLKKLGYSVPAVADNGLDAINLAKQKKPDLILMDIFIKGPLDGIDASIKIAEFSSVPVVFLTAYQTEEVLERSKLAKPYGYLLKPLNERDLNSCLRLALFRYESERKLREAEEKYSRFAENTNEKLEEMRALNKALINSIPDLLFYMDKDGTIKDYKANDAGELAMPPELFLNKKLHDVFPKEYADRKLELIETALKTGKVQLYEYQMEVNGEQKDYEARYMANGENEVLSIIRDITEKKKTERALKRSLHEKEVLLKEIHHRVKNNLQIVTSLLKLQSGYIKDENVKQLFKESQNRVQSMSLIHQKLYQTKDLSYVDFKEYIDTLANHLQHSFGLLEDRVKIVIDVHNVRMSIDNAIPAGLIINELITNALKHAFTDNRKGEIYINLANDEFNKEYWLVVRDNGIGIDPGFDIKKSESFGLKLVSTLVGQMSGSLEIFSSSGAEFRIMFKHVEYKERN